jgi:hypothetical protein
VGPQESGRAENKEIAVWGREGLKHPRSIKNTLISDYLPCVQAVCYTKTHDGRLRCFSETRDCVARLLILACSQKKRASPALLPAIARYDGPAFQVVRRYLAHHPNDLIDLFIVSARFGLITGDTLIPHYDQRMQAAQAHIWQPVVHARLRHLATRHTYHTVFISVGREYAPALHGAETLFPAATVKVAGGSQGRRLSELYDWLHQELPPAPLPRRTAQQGTPQLRGVTLNLSSREALEYARHNAKDDAKATAYQSWYVPVDDQRIAPKWLVSRLTGLAPKDFHTDEARRVLGALGIEVRRV